MAKVKVDAKNGIIHIAKKVFNKKKLKEKKSNWFQEALRKMK